MTELVARTRLAQRALPRIGGLLIVERNAMVYRRTWMIVFSGFFEPLFYLAFFVYPFEKIVPDSVLVRRSTLEDVFLHLTGRSLIE